MTVVGYGAQIQHLRKACTMAREELDVSCELIDLRTLLPWDTETVANVRIGAFDSVEIRSPWVPCSDDALLLNQHIS